MSETDLTCVAAAVRSLHSTHPLTWPLTHPPPRATPPAQPTSPLRSAPGLWSPVSDLRSPVSSTRDQRSRLFYRLSAGRDAFAGKHLVVVVKYVNEPKGIKGYVSTLYLSRTVYARGEQLWPETET